MSILKNDTGYIATRLIKHGDATTTSMENEFQLSVRFDERTGLFVYSVSPRTPIKTSPSYGEITAITIAPKSATSLMLEIGLAAMNEFYDMNPSASPAEGLGRAYNAMMNSFLIIHDILRGGTIMLPSR